MKKLLSLLALVLCFTTLQAQNTASQCYRGFADAGYTIGVGDYDFGRFEINTEQIFFDAVLQDTNFRKRGAVVITGITQAQDDYQRLMKNKALNPSVGSNNINTLLVYNRN